MLFRKSLGVLIALSALHGAAASAQERVNPFAKPPTAAEEQARQDERTRNIIREMQPELKVGIMQDVKASQSALEIDLRRRIDTVATVAANAQKAEKPAIGGDAPIGEVKNPEGAPEKVPEGAVFISCVNGKALYRATDKSFFQIAGDNVEGGYSCAR